MPMTVRRFVGHAALGLVALVLALVLLHASSSASLFGEENITLGAILSESIKSYDELRQITDAVGEGAELAGHLVDAYQKVNAGVDELRGYSVDAFLRDFKGDMYHLYPGLAKIENGSARLTDWDNTHTTSPFTAYEAIGALAGDLTAPLRDDVRAGRRSIDKELILETEAAGGFALADLSETSTQAYDREVTKLRDRYERQADPGTAAMVAAHANLLIAEQNSHIIRLLARTVRLDGVDKALRAADRLSGLRDSYRRQDATAALAQDALKPPRMMKFDAVQW
jgi:hypothetical protein